MKFCCDIFKEAYEDGVIGIPSMFYRTHKGLEMEKFYLFDRDCIKVDVRVPIEYCPYCGKHLIISNNK